MKYKIGDSFIGYKFEDNINIGLFYSPRMEPHIGQKGRIMWVGDDRVMISFPDGDTWSYPITKYKPKSKPRGVEVVWVRLIKEYDGIHYSSFPKDLKVGDITWVSKDFYDRYEKYYLIENNKYSGNFERSYFEIIEKETPTIKKKELPNFNPEPHYEVY